MTRNADQEMVVKQVVPESEDTTSVVLEGPGLDRFANRKAGQFATIRVFKDGQWSKAHPFTISCAPEDEDLRMTIKRAGEFTAGIRGLEPGTRVQCAGPYGAFCADIELNAQIVMIAGGVGVTPFLSVLRHFDKTRATNSMLLFWANKTMADAFAATELAELAEKIDLRVVHVLSREKGPLPAAGGRVSFESGHLTREVFAKYQAGPTSAYYLCGPPAMQEAVLAELAACDVDPGAVRKEAFVFNR